MEPERLPFYRRSRVLYAFGLACIVLGALILSASRIASPTDPDSGAEVMRADGLEVTLRPSTGAAGPITLIVEVRDAAGTPVTGATVAVRVRAAEMDMGTFASEAAEAAPGRYVAADVPFGMAGAWDVEAEIAAPEHAPVTVRTVLTVGDPAP